MPLRFKKQATIVIAASALLSAALVLHVPNVRRETVVTDPICSPEQFADDSSFIEGGFGSSSIEADFQSLKPLIKSHGKSGDTDDREEYESTLSYVYGSGLVINPQKIQNKSCRKAPQGGGFF